MTVLIADDDPISRRLLQATLTRAGFDVVLAENGDEAWRILQTAEAPKLAILDWLMPGLDGVEVCRKVRRQTSVPYVYILLLTSKDRKEDIIAGMEAGADDYLTKPFHIHELQVRLRAGQRILELEAALRASLAELAQARLREGEIGARIQQTLLLGQPPCAAAGLRIAALTIPSQQIDGDFYDFFLHHEQCLDVVVGDVMGKGVPAALLGAAIKSHILRALSYFLGCSPNGQLPAPEEIVARVHADVTRQFIGLEIFATLCYARFYRQTNHVVFVDCGHTKTIHWRQQMGVCETLQGENMPLGVSEREVYQQVSVPFAVGDTFCFYSDGLTEARNEYGEFFGVERLTQLVSVHSQCTPQELITRVREAVITFTGSETFGDDLTCVVVQIENLDADPPVAHEELEVSSALTELAALRRFVRVFCQGIPPPTVDDETISQLELAVNEAASNIMRHAYEGRTDQTIRIVAEAFADRICLYLIHNGKAFDSERVAPPAFDGSRDGGFGLYMIAQSVDSVRYFGREQGENGVCLEKKR
jgi:sigma-B regulation protein RsbU (phosphoserine phosphatase)